MAKALKGLPPVVERAMESATAWFDGGQATFLNWMAKLKNPPDRKEALGQFNELNNRFIAEHAARQAPAPAAAQSGERPKTHPAIDAAVDKAIQGETGWMSEIRGFTDGQLQDRYLDRALKYDVVRNRVDPKTTLSEYKEKRPDLVEIGSKHSRQDLERKEVLSRMVQDRRFTISKAKVDWERTKNPELVAVAEKNIAGRNLRGEGKYNDALYSEIGSVKKTVENVKSLGVKL